MSERVGIEFREAISEEHERKIVQLLATGRKLFENQEISLALNVFRELTRIDPKNPEAFKSLGLCYEKKEEHEKAKAAFQRWNSLCRSAESYGKLGLVYLRLHDEAMAVDCFERALRQKGLRELDRYELLNQLGNTYLRKGFEEKAERCYLDALKIVPQSDRTFVNMGTLKHHLGDHKSSKKYFEEAVKINATSSRALCGLGLVAQVEGRWLESVDYYKKALDADWSNMLAIHGLIRSGQELDDYKTIEHYLKRYLARHPSNVAILYCLAGNYFHQKKWRACHEEIQKIELIEPYHEPTQELKDLLIQAERT